MSNLTKSPTPRWVMDYVSDRPEFRGLEFEFISRERGDFVVETIRPTIIRASACTLNLTARAPLRAAYN
jgi:hypothetical protein